jgi:hypothetical protein
VPIAQQRLLELVLRDWEALRFFIVRRPCSIWPKRSPHMTSWAWSGGAAGAPG